ncbi:hypothetical protein ACP70R_046532 [Stipagrostis hirtigluma subsp. patula]
MQSGRAAYRLTPTRLSQQQPEADRRRHRSSLAMATRWQPRPFPLVPILLCLLAAGAYGRPIPDGSPSSHHLATAVIHLSSSNASSAWPPAKTEQKCQPSYGFLPCTTTVLGNLFLVLVYGFPMYKAATYISAGSDVLLEIMGPGLVGGLLLPILSALPDSLLILVSGLSASKETAQSQILIGMGLLAGSTVVLLTLLWGTCVVVGKCDLGPDGEAVASTDTTGFSLTGSGVTTDVQTSYAAGIMGISVIPLFIAQFAKIVKTHHGKRIAALLALIVSFLLVISYCVYQVIQPWIQKRKLAYAKRKHVLSGILRHAQMQGLGRLLNEDGTPNESVIRKLFHKIDLDQSHNLTQAELHALIVGINFDEVDFDKEDAVDKVMDDFDTSRDVVVDEQEFVEGMKKWLNEAKRTMPAGRAYSDRFIDEFHERTRREHDELMPDDGDETVEKVENPGWYITKAVGLQLLGVAIAAAFANPLVATIQNLSSATHIPPFFISFIALPLATNSSEAVSTVIFASQKKQRTCSLILSMLYGIPGRVLIILLVCLVMALFASFRTTFPLWTCLVAYALYPLSLVIVCILDYVFHWK